MTTHIFESALDAQVVEDTLEEVRPCETPEGRSIFDSPFLGEFLEEEYLEENPDASFTELALARSEYGSLKVIAEAEAKSKCNSCFFKDDCIRNAYAIEDLTTEIDYSDDSQPLPVKIFGVVGGLNEDERRALFSTWDTQKQAEILAARQHTEDGLQGARG